MAVNNVGGNNSANQIYDLLQKDYSKKSTTPQESGNAWEQDYVVELSNQKPTGKAAVISGMKADLQKNTDALRQMVQKLIEKQGGVAQGAGKDFLVKIDEATRAEAQELIAEDGYWGVNKTAERILDFAKAISGGDASKIGALKDAVMKGFKQAEKAWGGKLPDISQQTLDKVMAGFDEWEQSGE